MEKVGLGWQHRLLYGEAFRPRSPRSGDSDMELLRAFADQRCPKAFACLYERHAGLVLRACRRRLKRIQDAEDVAQAVFLELALHPERVQVNLAGWLYEVANRLSINKHNSDHSRYAREQGYDAGSPGPRPGEREELREEIEAALAHLPAAVREAVILCHMEGMTQQEAARAAGCDRGTISRRVGEGVAQLRSVLGLRGFNLSAPAIFTILLPPVPAEGVLIGRSTPAPEIILRAAAAVRRREALVFLAPRIAIALGMLVGLLGLALWAWPEGPPQAGLVGHYRFDEGSGTRVADASPAKNHGVLAGGARWVKDGRKGGALEFDGKSGHVLLSADVGRQLQGDASVCFWLRLVSRGGTSWTSPGVLGVTGTRLADLAGCSVWGCVGYDGRVFAQAGCHGQVASAAALDDGAWHHVAIVRTATTGLIQLYVDGAKQSERFSEPGPRPHLYRSLGRIEALPGAAEHYLRGSLDEVLLYSRALSEREVQSLAR